MFVGVDSVPICAVYINVGFVFLRVPCLSVLSLCFLVCRAYRIDSVFPYVSFLSVLTVFLRVLYLLLLCFSIYRVTDFSISI